MVVVVAYYPPEPGGMSTTMHNLLSRFRPTSYSVVTAGGLTHRAVTASAQAHVYRVISSLRRISSRLDLWWQQRNLPTAVANLCEVIDQTQAKALVAVYPTYHFLKVAREAALLKGLPWVAYLHDTVAEGLSNTPLAKEAAVLQDQVFVEAARVFVMSQGMAELWRRKFDLDCVPLEHTYPEAIPQRLPERPTLRQAFWAGATYGINDKAVARVSSALGRLGCPFLLTTTARPRHLRRSGLVGDHIRTTFFRKRSDYLVALQQQGLLILALNWPDEASLHEDELATIFPTKTPEYLASGRPILVHCPEHYFLAKFFRRYGCGIVVSDRSEAALVETMAYMLIEPPDLTGIRVAALAAAQQFRPTAIAARLREAVEAAVQEAQVEKPA